MRTNSRDGADARADSRAQWGTQRQCGASGGTQAACRAGTGLADAWKRVEGAVRRVEPAVCASERARTLLDPGGELLDLVVRAPIVLDLLEDLALGIHDRGVVLAAERHADLGQ